MSRAGFPGMLEPMNNEHLRIDAADLHADALRFGLGALDLPHRAVGLAVGRRDHLPALIHHTLRDRDGLAGLAARTDDITGLGFLHLTHAEIE